MSFCSFSGEYEKNSSVVLDSKFITEYLPEAGGDAVRVYVYGLFSCRSGAEVSLSDFSAALNLSTEEVKDCFKFWEEYDLVSVISEEPFSVRYLPFSEHSKPRRFKPEKYTDFTKALQVLFPDRMITTAEYSSYFSVMESFGLKPEAMLMICQYCKDIKGSSIGYKYVLTVAKDFAYRGIITPELIEKELSDYKMRSGEVTEILKALGIKRSPEPADQQYFVKWKNELGYELKALLFAAKKCKRKNIEALDGFISELYANKLFTENEIDEYVKKKDSYRDLARRICKNLSVYVEVIDPVVDQYVAPWLAKGYDFDTLELLATLCFKRNKRSLEAMSEWIDSLYDKGLISLTAIADYAKNTAKYDDFIKKILEICGVDRRPTDWDRQTLAVWQNWGFTEDMVVKAAERAAGTLRPVSYMNVILSDWKSKGIFTPEAVPERANSKATSGASLGNKTKHFESEHQYTKEEIDKLMFDINDIEF